MVDDNQLTHGVHLRYTGGQREIKLDQKKIDDRKQLLYHNPTIIFSYDDYGIVTEGHERRRNFFDQIQCFRSIHYVDLMRNYKRVLHQRNKSLKERNVAILDTYNYQLAKYGLQIMDQRAKCIDVCSQHASEIFKNVSPAGHTLALRYSSSWDIDSDVAAVVHHLEQRTDNDLRNGYSDSGPHRDRIRFSINTKDATTYASTGQIRSIALIVKVVQSMIIFDNLQKKTGIIV